MKEGLRSEEELENPTIGLQIRGLGSEETESVEYLRVLEGGFVVVDDHEAESRR